jgi:hypothetical protein
MLRYYRANFANIIEICTTLPEEPPSLDPNFFFFATIIIEDISQSSDMGSLEDSGSCNGVKRGPGGILQPISAMPAGVVDSWSRALRAAGWQDVFTRRRKVFDLSCDNDRLPVPTLDPDKPDLSACG